MIERRRGFRRVSATLAQVPSLAYGLAYLLLIPVFALAYSLYAGEFYHSTAPFEHSLHTDADDILEAIGDAVRKAFVSVHGGEQVEENGWTLALRDVSYYALSSGGGSVSLTVKCIFRKVSPNAEAHVSARVSFPERIMHASRAPDATDWTDYKGVTVEERPLNFDGVPSVRLVFPYRELGMSDEGLWLPMPRALSARIGAFAAATRGFPRRVTGGFWRMLYLSAVTITTLGYGDIVPLTPLTRALVAAEAVLGVVVIGLFLNSLAHESQ